MDSTSSELMPSWMLRKPCSCSSSEHIPCEPSPSTFSLWCSYTLFFFLLFPGNVRNKEIKKNKLFIEHSHWRGLVERMQSSPTQHSYLHSWSGQIFTKTIVLHCVCKLDAWTHIPDGRNDWLDLTILVTSNATPIFFFPPLTKTKKKWKQRF